METIFTLDARDNIFLEVVKEYFNLDEVQIHNSIKSSFNELISILNKKKINYKELKKALIPSEKKEIAFVFDTLVIEDSWYGLSIMSALIPLLDKNSSNSILVGDYIGNENIRNKLRTLFYDNIKTVKRINYKHHSQYHIIYINNLSDRMVETITNGLSNFKPYVGYFDLTYSSYLKTYISTILVRLLLKNKNIIIQGHEDDISNDEDINISGYPFEENGYTCKSIQSIYYSLFLSYKIERKVINGFQSDTTFSLNAITDKVFDISKFKLLVEEKKLSYLLKEKFDSIKRIGITDLDTKKLEKLIENKIESNYIYNLSFLEEHNTMKFNIILEIMRNDNNKPFKLTLALEYKPVNKNLRLITMY